VVGSFTDAGAVAAFAETVDVLTVEIEHVDVASLAAVEAAGRVSVVPSSRTVALIQDKYAQKVHFQDVGVPLAPFAPLHTPGDVTDALHRFGYPLLFKRRRGAYDGRGNATVRTPADVDSALAALGGLGDGQQLYAEAWAPFVKELAVMVVRSTHGDVAPYPVCETVHKDHICDVVTAPAPGLPHDVIEEARKLAVKAVRSLPGAGIFGVELFLVAASDDVAASADGPAASRWSLLLNEIAPRPHNSGHYTIDACVTCQFENCLRAVLGWPLGDTSLLGGAAMMINILGSASGAPGDAAAHRLLGAALATPGAAAHWYGKAPQPKRKVGHITLVGDSHATLAARAQHLLAAAAAGDGVDRGVSGEGSAQFDAVATAALRATAASIEAATQGGVARPLPVVGVIMGSDSDLSCMSAACSALETFGVPYEVTIVSAHRTPERLLQYSRSAAARGLRCIIAGAGGAAHLPGMVAALTPLPVIGVPVPLKYMDGMDSLLSIVQMPGGVPVATVAVGNATNAGLLAVRMLASGDAALLARMEQYQDGLRCTVQDKATALETMGWRDYLLAARSPKSIH
jgi:phosphoribosylaminoimidazole carboxylase